MGVGFKWALPTTVYFVAAVIMHAAAYPRFVIVQAPFATFMIVGALFVAAGVSLYLTALMSLRKGLRSRILVTDGLYAFMRHPLYAASIFFIIPGVAFAFRSWLLLPMPVVAYVICRAVLPAEDDELLDRYGEQFLRYKQKTNALFPTQLQQLRVRNAGSNRKE